MKDTTTQERVAFPTTEEARQAQVERLKRGRAAMLKKGSYAKMRDWFADSEPFAFGRKEFAAWVREEFENPETLADTIMESVFTPERTREIFEHILNAVEDKAHEEHIQQEITRILADYVNKALSNDDILWRVYKEVEDRAGVFGGLAHLIGAIDTRVLTHDIADGLRKYVASLDNEHKGDYERIVAAIFEGLRGIDVTEGMARRTIRGLVVEVLVYSRTHVVSGVESFDLTTLTPGQDRVVFRMYKGVVNAVFDMLESFAEGKVTSKKKPGLFDVVNEILREA